jgi:hypothetical protein
MDYKFPSWTVARINVRRPTQDNRLESWRLNDTTVAIEQIRKTEQEFDLLQSLSVPSIKSLNENRLSLGIIRPTYVSPHFSRREEIDPFEQATLWDRLESSGPLHKSDLVPRVRFGDADGSHSLQIKEWGCAEFLRKHRSNAGALWDAPGLRLNSKDHEHLLLVGNQKDRRSSWLVIRVISRRIEPKTLDLFAFADDEKAA